ncbi:hypothetical protein [Pseudomonas sp. AP-1]|uniref:hypothetical protein n=1 Tax=Pseudomonas sp. AP-1 TaxID=3231718 RepID=UPI0035B4D447
MAVHDFNAAALRAYRKRQDKGAIEVVANDSPLATAARVADDMEVIDLQWLAEVDDQLSPEHIQTVRHAAHAGAHLLYGAPTPAQILGMAHNFLRYLDRIGVLDAWRKKS